MRYDILPLTADPLTEERESEKTHTPFYYELSIFNHIKDGDVDAVKKEFKAYIQNGFTMGAMSANSAMQWKYWAVCGIALAVHYAILGGADETDCFNRSDECIRKVDNMLSIDDLEPYLYDQLSDLTLLVHLSKLSSASSPEIRRALHYIHLHIHQKITASQLADECLLSVDYLPRKFKAEIGMTLHSYILKEKLKAAKEAILRGDSISKAAYGYGFCSESHFITCFKKEFGMTPAECIKRS